MNSTRNELSKDMIGYHNKQNQLPKVKKIMIKPSLAELNDPLGPNRRKRKLKGIRSSL